MWEEDDASNVNCVEVWFARKRHTPHHNGILSRQTLNEIIHTFRDSSFE